MRNGPVLAIVAIAGLALYAYTQAAAASAAPSTDGNALPFDFGNIGDDFPSWNSSPIGATQSDGTGAADTPDPGIDFGIFSEIGKAVNGWKTGEYSKYASAIRDAEARYGIPADLLARLLYQESHFRADVIAGYNRSPKGALGIAQFMPPTAAEYGLQLVPFTYQGNATQTYDPYQSIDAAGRFLRNLYRMFNDWRMALMAYNWGPGHVQTWNRDPNSSIVPEETRKYVAQITADVQVA